eukprot:CAMPEP_0195021960 /NCGR_PEP_ID=MMETSP0326_2-20130528/39247_1 /TAXON_ID=2866 ORGANISM="Crypthecodinium cohnii, Strain Seligo" /NCGR_SAMPLE_ID=MMETSP0326_2 /ASSEMBLY_ACC=CAM_ASM_000348 /LENGTH=39 /DNA_ID= /DNA_START= /DNA_END= /DNA_ORIENTATION=
MQSGRPYDSHIESGGGKVLHWQRAEGKKKESTSFAWMGD